MKSLRKKPSFNELVYSLHHQPTIRYPDRKGLNMINNPIISHLLLDDDSMNDKLIDDKLIKEWEEIMISDKATQTPYERELRLTA